MTKSQDYGTDLVLDEILSHDKVEKVFEAEVSRSETRAAKCRKLADGFFKTRGIHSASSDVKALAMLLFRVTSPRPPGRPRKKLGAGEHY